MENQDWTDNHSKINDYSSIPKAGAAPSAIPKLTFADAPASPPSVQIVPPTSVPPETIAAPVVGIKYAGFWVRYVANIIDGLVLMIPLIAIDLVLFFLAGNNITFKILVYFLNYLITWTYFVGMTYAYQATLGKMAVGVKVVSDKSDHLTVGQLILRETLGKIISLIILYVGFMMAGFTERKQALHDKMAKTVVVYKDPNHKVAWWAIALALVLPAIAILGIFSSIVLVSLNNARNKARDAAAGDTIQVAMNDAVLYANDHNSSFQGFSLNALNPPITIDSQMEKSNGQPIINISPDGQKIAMFWQSSQDKSKYFCDNAVVGGDANVPNYTEVDAQFAKTGAFDCGRSSSSANDLSGIPQDTGSASNVPSPATSNVPAPANAAPPQSAAAPMINYSNSTLGFSIQYPAGWKEDDSQLAANSTVIFADQGKASVSTSSQAVPPAQAAQIGTMIERSMAALGAKAQSNQGKVFDSKDFTYNGGKGVTLTGKQAKLEYQTGGKDIEQWVVIFPGYAKNRLYIWVYSSTADQFETYKPEAINVLNSWKILQ